MRAIRVHEFGEPDCMRMEQMEDPQPGEGEVLVRIKAAGVNPVDTYIRSGQYGRLPELPYTPGMDAAGIIESIGPGVTSVAVGDRVYTAGALTGTYAELARCSESQVHPLPEHVSFEQGAAVGVPYAIAYRALFHRAQARAGETVLVHGATGGVGIAAVQLARAAGMKVIGTGGSEKGRALVIDQGAHHAVDHHSPDHLEQIREWNNDRGVDVVVEMLANVNLGNDLSVLDQGGRVVVIGSRGTVEIDPRDAMSRDASILGVVIFNASDRDMASIYAALGAGLENGTLRPVVGREMPLEEAPASHVEVLKPSAYGKIVLIP